MFNAVWLMHTKFMSDSSFDVDSSDNEPVIETESDGEKAMNNEATQGAIDIKKSFSLFPTITLNTTKTIEWNKVDENGEVISKSSFDELNEEEKELIKSNTDYNTLIND
jgi:hypothetical protein